MSFKVYKTGNYVYIENEDNSSLSDYPCKDLRFDKPTANADTFNAFFNNKPLGFFTGVSINDIKDESGTVYSLADFNIFYKENTGNFSQASVSGAAGFMDYNDTTGAISLVANTWIDVPNNGSGAFTNKTYKPDGVTEFIDVSTGYIDVNETDLGDTILIRNDYKVNPSTNNALLEFRYELGTGGGIYTLEKIVGRLDSGSGQDYRFSLEPDLIYMGDTNTKDNPIKLQLKLSTNGTLTNAGSAITLVKR